MKRSKRLSRRGLREIERYFVQWSSYFNENVHSRVDKLLDEIEACWKDLGRNQEADKDV